jgi:pantetheine-phosphate adenylyltransferase
LVKAVFPGTFDPVTVGHVDVAERAHRLFDRLVIGVYVDPPKRLTFSVKERVAMFRRAVTHLRGVEVVEYHGLTVDLARQVGAMVIVRGLRIGSDFEYEREMALMNMAMQPDIETVCLLSSLEHQFISSTRVKEIAGLGGDVSSMVPPHVGPLLKRKLKAAGVR